MARVTLPGCRTMFAAHTLETVSRWSRNERTDVSWACFWTLIM